MYTPSGVPPQSVVDLTAKLKTQKGIVIQHDVIAGANHFFEGKVDELVWHVGAYLDSRKSEWSAPEPAEED